MSLAARDNSRGRPQLRLVRGSFQPAVSSAAWRRVAQAVVACTLELATHLRDQRWARADEVLRERRELLGGMERMPLDADGRRCLVALQEAAAESERAIAQMIGRSPDTD